MKLGQQTTLTGRGRDKKNVISSGGDCTLTAAEEASSAKAVSEL